MLVFLFANQYISGSPVMPSIVTDNFALIIKELKNDKESLMSKLSNEIMEKEKYLMQLNEYKHTLSQ